MITVGLDISTLTGMALTGHLDFEDRGKVVSFPDQKGMQRLQLIALEVERTIQLWNPDLAMIERYAFCQNKDTFALMVSCATVIKLVLHRLQIPWMEVTPKTLKKWTTGNGNATKEHMAIASQERWGFVSPSNDIVDAFCLAKMGQIKKEELLSIQGVFQGI